MSVAFFYLSLLYFLKSSQNRHFFLTLYLYLNFLFYYPKQKKIICKQLPQRRKNMPERKKNVPMQKPPLLKKPEKQQTQLQPQQPLQENLPKYNVNKPSTPKPLPLPVPKPVSSLPVKRPCKQKQPPPRPVLRPK